MLENRNAEEHVPFHANSTEQTNTEQKKYTPDDGMEPSNLQPMSESTVDIAHYQHL